MFSDNVGVVQVKSNQYLHRVGILPCPHLVLLEAVTFQGTPVSQTGGGGAVGGLVDEVGMAVLSGL